MQENCYLPIEPGDGCLMYMITLTNPMYSPTRLGKGILHKTLSSLTLHLYAVPYDPVSVDGVLFVSQTDPELVRSSNVYDFRHYMFTRIRNAGHQWSAYRG
jgi:hypothetical protein